ncbi:TetR/AcrR family transcriptional regulator [Sinomonas sp. P47F7]|uniref:TetR/AcrR family transcriptional regulator n=1 Tax=Sinomonas sp. P47F7 TaxID=3410987 RepID=UPI003BF4AAA0
MPLDRGSGGPRSVDARGRILEAAYALFAEHGIRATGVEEIIARSGAARATFYAHFRSKDEVAIAYLERLCRGRAAQIDAAGAARGEGPGALVGVFDVFGETISQEALRGSSFVHVLFELGTEHPVGRASIQHFARLREHLAGLAAARGMPSPEAFARDCQLLVKGMIVSAAEGDPHAAEHARAMAEHLIERYVASPRPLPAPGGSERRHQGPTERPCPPPLGSYDS